MNVVDHAPPDATTGGGGGGGWAWLVTANGVVEAQLIRGALEASGIVPVALDATDPTPGAWLFLSGNPNALVRVFVPASLLDAARLALLETGLTGEPEPPVASSGPGSRPGISTWVWVAITVLLVAIYVTAMLRGVRIGP
jgi:hypothetical protein